MPRERNIPERISDWLQAYNAVRDEITPREFRALITAITQSAPKDPETGGPSTTVEDFDTYVRLLNSSLSIANVVAANDRIAATVAESMTRNGLDRPREG